MADQKKKKPAESATKTLPAPPVKRTGPVQFFQEVRREVSKVTWPTFRETWLTTVMVFIMVGMTMVFLCPDIYKPFGKYKIPIDT